MLQALLNGKLSRERAEEIFGLEDLLTSIVLGSASYLDFRLALLPFLSEARAADGAYVPWPRIVTAEAEFWPSWTALTGGAGAAAASQPEVIVRLTDAAGRRYWLLVEVKLGSGKSSRPTAAGPVNDQLAKYWLHLRARARDAGAEPLGVVYVTASAIFPDVDIAEANAELRAKHGAEGAFYWVSWRRFVRAVAGNEATAPLLRDVVALLRDEWGLDHVDVSPTWPPSVRRPSPHFFRLGWSWPTPAARPPANWFAHA